MTTGTGRSHRGRTHGSSAGPRPAHGRAGSRRSCPVRLRGALRYQRLRRAQTVGASEEAPQGEGRGAGSGPRPERSRRAPGPRRKRVQRGVSPPGEYRASGGGAARQQIDRGHRVAVVVVGGGQPGDQTIEVTGPLCPPTSARSRPGAVGVRAKKNERSARYRRRRVEEHVPGAAYGAHRPRSASPVTALARERAGPWWFLRECPRTDRNRPP